MLDRHVHHHTEQAPGLFGALALVGLVVTIAGPVLALAALLAAGFVALVAYLAVCDLGGWLMVVFATRSFPPNTWPLTGGLFKIVKRVRK